jgi:hypothetical protein
MSSYRSKTIMLQIDMRCVIGSRVVCRKRSILDYYIQAAMGLLRLLCALRIVFFLTKIAFYFDFVLIVVPMDGCHTVRRSAPMGRTRNPGNSSSFARTTTLNHYPRYDAYQCYFSSRTCVHVILEVACMHAVSAYFRVSFYVPID